MRLHNSVEEAGVDNEFRFRILISAILWEDWDIFHISQTPQNGV
jgi:hypothetical protein